MSRNLTPTVTIANGGTVSTKFDMRREDAVGIVIPASFTGTAIQFQVSADDSTYQTLYDITGAVVQVSVSQGRSYDLPGELMAWPWAKIVSGSAEGAARTLKLVLKS